MSDLCKDCGFPAETGDWCGRCREEYEVDRAEAQREEAHEARIEHLRSGV